MNMSVPHWERALDAAQRRAAQEQKFILADFSREH